jgi:16S rRNA processing protein RimM
MSDQTDPRPAEPEYLIVGQIVAPFGVRGEMKVNVLTEFPDRFKKLEAVILAPFDAFPPGDAPTASLDPSTVKRAPMPPGSTFRPPKTPTEFPIEGTRVHKGQLLLKLEGVDDPAVVEALRGYWVVVPLEQARKLPRGAYYLYQVVGLPVVTTDGEEIGTVEEVLSGGANDVYVIRGPGVHDSSGELLVPAVKQFVKRLDVKGGRVVIAPPSEWT